MSLPLLLQQHQWCRDGKTSIEMQSKGRVQFLTSVPAISRTSPCPVKREGHVPTGFNFLCSPPIVPLGSESAGGRSSRRRRFRLLGYPHQLGWELLLPVFWIWDCPKIWLSEQVDIEFGRREGLPWSTNHLQCSITVLSVIFSAVYFHVSGKDDLVWTGGLN